MLGNEKGECDMQMRPIDIARKLKVSTTMLRHYEEFGMIPAVLRSPSGYRIFTEEHVAYFICIREMMHGFTMTEIAHMLRPVLEGRIDEALWMANNAQVVLQNDKFVCENIRKRFLTKKKRVTVEREFTIDAVSKSTGIIPSTIRYWDNIGLISAYRCTDNNYRTFTQKNIDEILIVQALKLAMRARGERYAVEQIRKTMEQFDFNATDHIISIVTSIESHLSMLNRAQIRSIAALYRLCEQVEQEQYEGL
jgi:DNA-binding transcriptional MerR regulator